jgi:excisionase family DNA binding protein
MDRGWFPVKQIAERLGITKHTVYTWTYAKRITAQHVGCFWKFKKDEVDEWVRAAGAATEATADQDAPAQCGWTNNPRMKNTP